jgi:hypothetical protein
MCKLKHLKFVVEKATQILYIESKTQLPFTQLTKRHGPTVFSVIVKTSEEILSVVGGAFTTRKVIMQCILENEMLCSMCHFFPMILAMYQFFLNVV